jgi:hypothetical protein
MVADNRPLLDALAHTLLENEVLEREDIERLVAEYRGGGPDGARNGDSSSVVPVPEPGKARMAAAEGLGASTPQPPGRPPSQ